MSQSPSPCPSRLLPSTPSWRKQLEAHELQALVTVISCLDKQCTIISHKMQESNPSRAEEILVYIISILPVSVGPGDAHNTFVSRQRFHLYRGTTTGCCLCFLKDVKVLKLSDSATLSLHDICILCEHPSRISCVLACKLPKVATVLLSQA